MTRAELFTIARDYQSRRWSNPPTIEEQEALTGFVCDECGEEVNYLDLEDWACTFDENDPRILCDCCYEEGMGEDL